MSIEYSNDWFSVIKDGRYLFVSEKNSANGAAVLIVEDHQYYIFVKQHRKAIDDISIEIPRGYGAPGESALVSRARVIPQLGPKEFLS